MIRKAALLLAAALVAPAGARPDSSLAAIGYICGAEQAGLSGGPRRIVLRDGVGNSRLKIAATPEAQTWFDYGLQLADGFYHDDAKAAFRRAVELDPGCAMCLWGEAWALGSTLNFPVAANENAKALAIVEKAETLARGPRETALIAAMKLRYTPTRAGFDPDKAFARAMDAIIRDYPDEPELEVIAAQAWMMNTRRGDKTGVEPAIRILEDVLRRHPDHAGAIHFYIHATEFAGRAAIALPYAQRLAALAPGASHLVHMPAHTLIHMGRYEDAAVLNAEALGVEASHRKALDAPGPLGSAAYYSHNLQFGLAGALMAGDGPLALKFADHAARAYPASLTPDQREGGLARTYIAIARFAPERMAAIPEPAESQPTLRVLWRYARGEAAAARGDVAAVRREAEAIGAMKPPAGASLATVTSLQTMAKNVLVGRAAMLARQPDLAIVAYTTAADYQDRVLTGWDPPLWWYPVRRSLAAALLADGRPAEAAAQIEQSLKLWPADGVALKVLAEARARTGDAATARTAATSAKDSYLGDLDRLTPALI